MGPVLDRVRAGEDDPACADCGGMLKSATISFGENLVPDDLLRAQSAAAGSDVFLAVGSSLTVYPAAGLPEVALGSGARLLVFNAQETPFDSMADAVVPRPARRRAPGARGSRVTGEEADARLEHVLEREVGRSVPGLAVLAADAERVLVDRSSGVADLASGVAMTPDAACNWFSLTKLVTATAAVQLSDRGRLDLDAPVVEVYEPFAVMEPATRARSVTTRHLLSHAAGVANPMPIRWVHRADQPGPDPSTFVESLLAKHRKLRTDPGERAVYTNVGYLVVGEIIARVAGVPYTEHVRTEILEPLGMTRTDFVVAPETVWARGNQRRATALGALMPLLVPRSIIAGRQGAFRTLRHFYVDGAAYGGLVGPPSDAIRFARAHIGDGQLDGVRVLSTDAARNMRRIVARGRHFEVGLGWFRRGRNPGMHLEHLGGGAGYWSCLRVEPDRGLTAVTMGNATKYDHESLVAAAFDAA